MSEQEQEQTQQPEVTPPGEPVEPDEGGPTAPAPGEPEHEHEGDE